MLIAPRTTSRLIFLFLFCLIFQACTSMKEHIQQTKADGLDSRNGIILFHEDESPIWTNESINAKEGALAAIVIDQDEVNRHGDGTIKYPKGFQSFISDSPRDQSVVNAIERLLDEKISTMEKLPENEAGKELKKKEQEGNRKHSSKIALIRKEWYELDTSCDISLRERLKKNRPKGPNKETTQIGQSLVETGDSLENSLRKLKNKSLDLIGFLTLENRLQIELEALDELTGQEEVAQLQLLGELTGQEEGEKKKEKEATLKAISEKIDDSQRKILSALNDLVKSCKQKSRKKLIFVYNIASYPEGSVDLSFPRLNLERHATIREKSYLSPHIATVRFLKDNEFRPVALVRFLTPPRSTTDDLKWRGYSGEKWPSWLGRQVARVNFAIGTTLSEGNKTSKRSSVDNLILAGLTFELQRYFNLTYGLAFSRSSISSNVQNYIGVTLDLQLIQDLFLESAE